MAHAPVSQPATGEIAMRGFAISAFLLAFAGLAAMTHAQTPTPMTRKSAHDVAATVARLEAATWFGRTRPAPRK